MLTNLEGVFKCLTRKNCGWSGGYQMLLQS